MMSSIKVNNAVFDQLGDLGHQSVSCCHDEDTGLKAIIAVHDTTFGASLGGIRMMTYKTEGDALVAVLLCTYLNFSID